jgi:hypothetical protein
MDDSTINNKAEDNDNDKIPVGDVDQKLLWEETGKGIANTLAHLRTKWYGDEAVYYQRERERLETKYLPPFWYGAAATAFLFVNFRVTGHPAFQRWRTRIWPSSTSSTTKMGVRETPITKINNATTSQPIQSNPSTAGTSSSPAPASPPVMMGYLETKRKTEIEKALKSMKFITDMLVSISVGISGTIFMLEGKRKYMRKDFEEAPLVSGRSVVAEQMCPDVLKVVSLDQEESSATQQMKRKDSNFATLMTFVGNCRKRSEYEKRVREKQGLQSDAPVTVPYSGLE